MFAIDIANCQDEEQAKEFSWPMEIESESNHITTLYQPQLDSYASNILEGRMAVSIAPPEGDIIYGALWFQAEMHTDKERRVVILEKMDIINTHFPEITDVQEITKFSELLSAEIESWNLEMSLDRLLASLDEVENLNVLADQINNKPPEIYFRTSPAVLVLIDGEPIYKEDENAKIEYVVNTPFFIVKDARSGKYYIRGGSYWFTSDNISNGWTTARSVPSNIEKFANDNYEEEGETEESPDTDAPELIISQEPAELLVVDGEIDYKPIENTKLLYVSNTEGDIIMDIESQNHFLLLAGRWYFSKTLKDGDWKFCEPKNLPEDFINIPDDSDMALVRASIPGTSETEIALLEQTIPQTATIDRQEATVEVTYDGNPKFEKIKGTSMSFAVNTDKTVLLIDNKYYCVDEAIWFMSDKASGPWEVCIVRPDEVDNIPPESPVYNVKYAYIYNHTPSEVYVGYTPGYTHCYSYGGVVVYGTGYYYRPWYHRHYYPRPLTYGYGVHYNPYSGWGFSFGISYGWVGWRYHPHRHRYWGPRGYYPGYRHGYHRHLHRPPHYGSRPGNSPRPKPYNQNIYRGRSNGVKRTGSPGLAKPSPNINNKTRPSTKQNNMYTDKKGNVYQRNQNGTYENRSNRPSTQQGSQRPSTGQQPSTRPTPSTTPNRQQLDRSYQNRQQGTQQYNRSQQYNSSGSSGTRSNPGRQSGSGSRSR